jgi:DHA2 family multidrug resistance protein-like MFS transporter
MTTPPVNPRTGRSGARGRIAMAAVLAAMVLVVLDAAIANVALPTIAQSLQVTPAMSIWVITAYQAALVMALLPCAALGESVGYRKVFTMGVAMFIGASLLCAVSPTLPWLVAARFLQGFGGAAVMSLGVALLRAVVPHDRLATAIGWNAVAVALSSAAGPTLGAAILSTAGWPWLFAVNLPLGALVLLAGRALPRVVGTGRQLDLISASMNAGAFALLVIGAELLPTRPLLAASLLVAAAAALTSLVWREKAKDMPLVPLDLLAAGTFRVSVLASVLCFAGVAAALVALPFRLQHEGLSVWLTGLYLTPWPLTVAIAAPLAARLTRHVSTAWLCAAGGVVLAIGLAAGAAWPSHGRLLPLIASVILCGLGFGLFQVPNNQNMFLSAPRNRSGAAGGMQGTARLTGQTLGAILMTMLFTLAAADSAPRIGLAVASILALAAGLVSLWRVRHSVHHTASRPASGSGGDYGESRSLPGRHAATHVSRVGAASGQSQLSRGQ